MPKPNIAVMYFPGNNCEIETLEAVRAAGMDGRILRWNTRENLRAFDGFVIPGGWAYEDRIRAGVIAAKDPVMNVVREEAKKGKPVLGICNGAQVLVETGMIPGLKDAWKSGMQENQRFSAHRKSEGFSSVSGTNSFGKVEMALAPNKNPLISGYYNAWVNIKKANNKNNAFTMDIKNNETFYLPIAHGEGRFVTKDKTLIKQLIKNKQIIFQYCTKEGKIEDKFPTNPNGSMLNIAAISNKEGNVMAIMPHPERAIWQRQVPNAKKTDQLTSNIKIFQSMKKYILKK